MSHEIDSPLDEPVFDPRNRILGQLLLAKTRKDGLPPLDAARLLDITVEELERQCGADRESFDMQTYLSVAVDVLLLLELRFASVTRATKWFLEEPHASFSGKTASQMVADGSFLHVRQLIESIMFEPVTSLQETSEPKLSMWTVWLDYYATGEGSTTMGLICYAQGREEALKKFSEEFDPYYAKGATAEIGIARNDTTQFLWSDKAMAEFEAIGLRGGVKATSYFHFNRA